MTKELSSLNEVYQTIAKVTSLDDALRLYQEFKGLTITFPTKLISADYVKQYLKKETQKRQQLSSRELQQLARKFDYSERQMRRFLRDIRQDNTSNRVEEEELVYITKWLEERRSEEGEEND
ncbi:Mor transcription activator family protein [Vagococcus teuberi]|uniref:Uncharacterized protein n=1 Tax=Vagococcus teuberi TaxID=519472 RepID=A0A1J0A3X9_9ENTE|nr:Mor transcription activator family protein [Vagococcus teuberi]APB30610.1 hypothetical protein BHY08_01475 [Vagococcus teuberi]